MSAETKAALEAAIEEHIANETGKPVGGWVVVTETTDLEELDEDEYSAYIVTRNQQSRFLTDGLLYNALDR